MSNFPIVQPFPGKNTLFRKTGAHKIIKPIVPLLVTFLKTNTSIPTISQLFAILSNLPKFILSMHIIKVPQSMFVGFLSFLWEVGIFNVNIIAL